MNLQEAALLVRLVAARYPRQMAGNPSELAKAWQLTLEDVPYAPAERALAEWFKSQKWPPDPSEIRGMVLQALAEIPSAEDAWASVLKHMRENGAIGGAPFGGPEVVQETVYAIGGWHRLRRSERPDEDREAFARAYATYSKRAMASTNVVELIRERALELEAEVG